MPLRAPRRTSRPSLSPVCMKPVPSPVTRPGTLAPGVSAPRAAALGLGGDRSSVPSGHPATVGTCSSRSPQRWRPVTRSPAIFLRRSPVCRTCRPVPGTPGCLWVLGKPQPQTLETSVGLLGSNTGSRATPEGTRVSSCQPWAQAPLCSSPHTGCPQGLAQGLVIADTVPTGAAQMATPHLLGHSGKAVLRLGPRVSRAGTGAALMGCLWRRGPSKLAA